jgi:hypothetical protein
VDRVAGATGHPALGIKRKFVWQNMLWDLEGRKDRRLPVARQGKRMRRGQGCEDAVVAGQADSLLLVDQGHGADSPALRVCNVTRPASKRRMRTHLDILRGGRREQEGGEDNRLPSHRLRFL